MPRLSAYRRRSDSTTATRQRGAPLGRRKSSGIHPSLRSALVVWVAIGIILLINVFTAGSSLLLCLPVQWLLYAANGALAASFALNDGYPPQEMARIGALAGFFGCILPALFYIVLSILGIPAFGIGLLGVAAWIFCAPLDLAVHAVLGALGATLFASSAK